MPGTLIQKKSVRIQQIVFIDKQCSSLRRMAIHSFRVEHSRNFPMDTGPHRHFHQTVWDIVAMRQPS